MQTTTDRCCERTYCFGALLETLVFLTEAFPPPPMKHACKYNFHAICYSRTTYLVRSAEHILQQPHLRHVWPLRVFVQIFHISPIIICWRSSNRPQTCTMLQAQCVCRARPSSSPASRSPTTPTTTEISAISAAQPAARLVETLRNSPSFFPPTKSIPSSIARTINGVVALVCSETARARWHSASDTLWGENFSLPPVR